MLGRMLIHSLVAAALIGSAAAVYAGTRDNGSSSSDTQIQREQPSAAMSGDGYIRPDAGAAGWRDTERRHGRGAGSYRNERDHERDRRDDDDD
jgi:hypothetical protein